MLHAPKFWLNEDWKPTRRVLNLCHTLIATSFAEKDAGGRSVGEDVPPNWFAAVGTGEESAGSGVGLDLVCLLEWSVFGLIG